MTPSGMHGSILILDEGGRHSARGRALAAGCVQRGDRRDRDRTEVGSCGTAAFHDRTVSVFDIANNPLWANFKDLALQYGLRACWSTPIHGSDGKVLGTFANYYKFVRDPSPVDRELTEMITRTAAMAIEQDRHARLGVTA